MAIKEAKTNTDLDALFTQLAEPFDPNQIKWRVTHTTQDGSRGAVVAYADPRAYTDRLNQLFTPTGWTRTYVVSTISAVTRLKKEKLIQTGKVLVTCTLTITGLGCHAGSGEDWADESNAMTTAEAQAFKRAASCYGLGRYLYNLAEMWVPLNEHRQPFEFPSLPQWALPKTSAPVKSHPASGPQPTTVQRGPIDQRITGKIEGFRRILGDPIYGEILWRVARTQKANAIPNAQLQTNVEEAMERAARGIRKAQSSQLQTNVEEAMERAARGIRKAQSLAESIGDTQFVSVLDRLHIGSMTTISNLEALKHLVSELEGLAGQPAA